MRPRSGLPCRILVPETASYPKIAQIAACGADVVTIKGSRQDVADAALRQSAEIFYASHNWQPFFVEGMKTLAYELWEQLGFQRARQRRRAARLRQQRARLRARLRRAPAPRARSAGGPRLFGVQAANCAPYYAAFRAGVEHLVPTTIAPTVAEGIASAKPTRVARGAARGARERGSRGGGGRSGDRGRARVLARRGLYVEPTSAAAAAGLGAAAQASGAIRPDETTVLVLTGSGLKASAAIGELLKLGARDG